MLLRDTRGSLYTKEIKVPEFVLKLTNLLVSFGFPLLMLILSVILYKMDRFFGLLGYTVLAGLFYALMDADHLVRYYLDMGEMSDDMRMFFAIVIIGLVVATILCGVVGLWTLPLPTIRGWLSKQPKKG